jgi:tetratricopeptide (TPR) repeat protein
MQFQKKGTTCTALVLDQDLAHIAHVGDSRIYKITDEGIEQLTDDHTQVEEMLKKGIISKEEAKNHPAKSVLVRALGIDSDIEVDIKENIPLKVGQNFVLCSDGLARVKKEEIKQIVSSNSPSDACKKLIQLAIERGGHDNITVQIIKICEDNKKLVSKDKGTDRKSSKRWFKFSIISVILIVILLLGLFFIKDINNLFSTKTILDNKPLGINNVDSYDGSSQTLMDKANYWFTIGQFDSALVSYNLILIDNPMHVGALNGIEMISNQYISQGKILMEQKKYEDALAYYRKAEELKSNDQKLQNLILFCEEKIQVLNSEQQSQRNNYLGEKNNLEENSTNLSDTENKDNLKGKSDISKIELSEWNFEGLTESDFNLYENGIIFLNTDQDKKAIFQHTKEDVDIAVELKFKANRLGDRAGIIIGYNEDQSDKDSYFLYTVERTGKFLLRKISGNNEEKLLIVEKPGEYNDHFFLKIKCLGPWLMIYNNDKLLDSWLNKEFIKGKIGLFVEKQTYADFSNFNVSSAFKNRTKN